MAIDVDAAKRKLTTAVDKDDDDSPGPDDQAAPQPSQQAEAENDIDARGSRHGSVIRCGLVVGLATMLALIGLVGWLGFRGYQAQQSQRQRTLFVQVARQSAINLTTINWKEADADVQRILDSATGSFRQDFQNRASPFVAVVKQVKAVSSGSVTAAGLESSQGDEAKVLIAVTVKTSDSAAAEQDPRAWRMRITVRRVDGEDKVSNVEFVP